MSFCKEKQREEIQMWMYVMTLEDSEAHTKDLANIVQFRWVGTPTNASPLQLVELGMDWIINQGGSWMNMMLKDEWVSGMVLTMRLFLWTFCEYSFMLS